MLGRRHAILRRSGAGGPAASMSWPPAHGLRTHPASPITGTDADVLSCTIAPGYVWQKVGTGNPITRDANGFHFEGGCYFEMTLPAPVTIQAISLHGVVTFMGATETYVDYDTMAGIEQHIFGALAGTDATLSARRSSRYLYCNMGGATLYARDMHNAPHRVMNERRDESRAVVGAHFTTLPEYEEYGGGVASVWANGTCKSAGKTVSETVTDKFIMGKDFWGTVHEGVVFTKTAESPLPLWGDGDNAQAVQKALADIWGTVEPFRVT